MFQYASLYSSTHICATDINAILHPARDDRSYSLEIFSLLGLDLLPNQADFRIPQRDVCVLAGLLAGRYARLVVEYIGLAGLPA